MGQKAFKTSETLSRWPSRGPPPLPAGPDKPDDVGGAAGDPERGAGWTMAELVRWPVHTTHSTALVLLLDGQTLLLQHLQAVDHLPAPGLRSQPRCL